MQDNGEFPKVPPFIQKPTDPYEKASIPDTKAPPGIPSDGKIKSEEKPKPKIEPTSTPIPMSQPEESEYEKFLREMKEKRDREYREGKFS